MLVTLAFGAAREVLGKNQTQAGDGAWEMVVPSFLLAPYTWCLKINLLNAILQHGSAIISISQLGNKDTDTVKTCPKLLRQSTKEREKKYMSES